MTSPTVVTHRQAFNVAFGDECLLLQLTFVVLGAGICDARVVRV